MKFLKLLSLLATFCAFASPALAQSEKWTYCYNRDENKVYFIPFSQAATTSKDTKKRCTSQTFFTGTEDFHMMDEDFNQNGQPSGHAGSAQIFVTNSGRQLLISQWNDLSKSNRIWVLEPDFKTNQVKRHCIIENFGDAFSATIDKQTGALKIFARQYRSETSEALIRKWVTCPI